MAKQLTADEALIVKNADTRLKSALDFLEDLKSFQLGNVYVEEYHDYWAPKKMQIRVDSLDSPIKYQVVHVSEEGIPYLRRLNLNNKPIGFLCVPPQFHQLRDLGLFINAQPYNVASNLVTHSAFSSNGETKKFVQDPEQLDSILLNQPYDPMAQARARVQLKSDIDKHNQRVRVKTDTAAEVQSFIKSLREGDKFWANPKDCYVVQAPPRRLPGSGRWAVSVLNVTRNTTRDLSHDNFAARRLYREQPRSFQTERKT